MKKYIGDILEVIAIVLWWEIMLPILKICNIPSFSLEGIIIILLLSIIITIILRIIKLRLIK